MIRTSGYYKEKQVGEEIVKNSNFENGLENWKNYGWKSVEWIPSYNYEPAVKLTFYPTICNFRYTGLIEIYPEDLLMMNATLKAISKTQTVYLSLYFYDKFGYYIEKRSYDVGLDADTNLSISKLFSVSEILTEKEIDYSVVRAVRPAIEAYQVDGWSDNDVLYIKNISLRRVNPEWFKVYPVMLFKINEPSGLPTGTFYSEEHHSGIFNKGEYNLNVIGLEESGGSNSITLSVTVQSYDAGGNIWYDAVKFDDVVCAAGGLVTNKVYTKIATAGLGMRQRVKAVLSGSGTPSVVIFNVSATYKQ